MLERLRKWLHDDVAAPIAEKFEELESRIEAIEVKVGLRAAPTARPDAPTLTEAQHATEEGKEP